MHTPKRSSVFAVFRIGFPSFSLDGECGSERCVLGPSLTVVERKVPFNTRGAEIPLYPCVLFAFVGLSNDPVLRPLRTSRPRSSLATSRVQQIPNSKRGSCSVRSLAGLRLTGGS